VEKVNRYEYFPEALYQCVCAHLSVLRLLLVCLCEFTQCVFLVLNHMVKLLSLDTHTHKHTQREREREREHEYELVWMGTVSVCVCVCVRVLASVSFVLRLSVRFWMVLCWFCAACLMDRSSDSISLTFFCSFWDTNTNIWAGSQQNKLKTKTLSKVNMIHFYTFWIYMNEQITQSEFWTDSQKLIQILQCKSSVLYVNIQ